MNNNQNGIDTLDVMTVLLSYLSLRSYEQNEIQTKKLDAIIYDMESKLEYQNKLLNKILERVDEIQNGK